MLEVSRLCEWQEGSESCQQLSRDSPSSGWGVRDQWWGCYLLMILKTSCSAFQPEYESKCSQSLKYEFLCWPNHTTPPQCTRLYKTRGSWCNQRFRRCRHFCVTVFYLLCMSLYSSPEQLMTFLLSHLINSELNISSEDWLWHLTNCIFSWLICSRTQLK